MGYCGWIGQTIAALLQCFKSDAFSRRAFQVWRECWGNHWDALVILRTIYLCVFYTRDWKLAVCDVRQLPVQVLFCCRNGCLHDDTWAFELIESYHVSQRYFILLLLCMYVRVCFKIGNN